VGTPPGKPGLANRSVEGGLRKASPPIEQKVERMFRVWWQPILSWALAAFFALASWLNAFDPKSIAAYQTWGYPNWFHFVTAGMELTTSALLIVAVTRMYGASLGCVVMIGAVLTLFIHGEYGHAILPTVIFASLMAVGWAAL
jgi:hypothetical protein